MSLGNHVGCIEGWDGEMVNGLLKNRESSSSRGPAGCKAKGRGSKGDAMSPALYTREGEEGRLPPSSSLHTISS